MNSTLLIFNKIKIFKYCCIGVPAWNILNWIFQESEIQLQNENSFIAYLSQASVFYYYTNTFYCKSTRIFNIRTSKYNSKKKKKAEVMKLKTFRLSKKLVVWVLQLHNCQSYSTFRHNYFTGKVFRLLCELKRDHMWADQVVRLSTSLSICDLLSATKSSLKIY